MRYSKKRQVSTASKIRRAAGVFVVAGVLIYAGYDFGIFAGKGSEPETEERPDMTQEERVAALADCLTLSGAKFFGASWCPHCQEQKAAFGDAVDRIPYIECADASGGQTQDCQDARIASYPTWVFSDGTRVTGNQPFGELARFSGCDWGG